MSARRWFLGSVAFLVLAGLIGAACGTGGPSSSERTARAGGGTKALPARPGTPDQSTSAPGSAPVDILAVDAALTLQQRVVKTADIALQLKKGDFDRQFQQVSLVAARHGGYVASSATSEAKLRSGTLVLRVPADQFEITLGELKGLGKLQSERISGQDVTGQVVDLEARLRNWEAQESVLLGLMKKATTIDESIKVQRALQDVQLSIEEIRGSLHALSDQADLSTISVALAEVAPVAPKPGRPSSFAKAWHRAVEGFVSVFAAVVVGLGYLVPLGLIGAFLALVVAVVTRRTRPRSAPTPS